jgi:nucleoside phosphorylase
LEVRVEICGVGQAECAAATAHAIAGDLAAGRRPDLAVLAGIAGVYGIFGPTALPHSASAGYYPLEVGDTVVVVSETVADLGRRERDGGFTPFFQKSYPATFIPDPLPAGITLARGVTVDMAGGIGSSCPVPLSGCHSDRDGSLRAIERGTLTKQGGAPSCDGPDTIPVVENMEGAAFMAVCARLGVAAMEVRTVSNRVGEAVTPANLDAAARRLAADLQKILENI